MSARRKDLRETDRSTGKSKRSRNSSNRASTESEVSGAAPRKKPHAGIKDKAVAFDTGTRQRRDARVKERRNVIHDVASGCLAPICLPVLHRMHNDEFGR
ncbi:Uncharacterised protein [Klebsiella pneumoniae]|nr:Uncharacterised protein [Klebsiella pneumoniae]